jgi:hypothetical protein
MSVSIKIIAPGEDFVDVEVKRHVYTYRIRTYDDGRVELVPDPKVGELWEDDLGNEFVFIKRHDDWRVGSVQGWYYIGNGLAKGTFTPKKRLSRFEDE